MVFSFFKKQPEKMITRPAAVPRPAAGNKEARAGRDDARDEKAPPPEAEQPVDESLETTSLSAFSDLEFSLSQSSLDFQVNADFDPVNAPAEEAAVLFANGQDAAAQAVLEQALKQQPSGPAERLWLMLFDLYRLTGQHAAFEATGIEYARAFEKSPPGWGAEREDAAKAATGRGGSMIFKGDLLGGNTASFEAVRRALDKGPALRLDLSKVKRADPEGCGRLLELLSHARKNRLGVELLGRDALAQLVQEGIEAGRNEQPAAGKECWLLLLELFQQQGRQEVFEDLAIDYAVTFEESPPSWEAGRVAEPEPPAQAAENAAEDDDAYALSGEIRSSRFGDLPAFVQGHEALLIDCTRLTRIDFISAGALLNVLTTVRGTGKQIVFRHPNRLVAELFRVVGLTAVASVVFAKH